jgi:DNA-binding CsgD family transcriptional regulator
VAGLTASTTSAVVFNDAARQGLPARRSAADVTARVGVPSARPAVGGSLCPREIEVLQGIAAGCTTTQLAAWLGLSEHTVKTHTRRVLGKLRARNRAHAVAIGYQRGLLVNPRTTPRGDEDGMAVISDLVELARLVSRIDPIPDLRRRAQTLLQRVRARAQSQRPHQPASATAPQVRVLRGTQPGVPSRPVRRRSKAAGPLLLKNR